MALIRHGVFGDLSIVPTAETSGTIEGADEVDSFSVLAEASGDIPPDSFEFGVSRDPRGLTLQKLTMGRGFQGFLKRVFHATSNVYFLAWAYDLSGQPIQNSGPVYFYPGQVADDAGSLIPIKSEETREFLGAGVLLYPARRVTAGIALRMQLWESHKGTRDFGESMAQVAKGIQESDLNQLLTLIAGATGAAPATVALAEQASLELAKVVGRILEARSDDYVDFFEGYFPAADPWDPPEQSWRGHASEIVLRRVS